MVSWNFEHLSWEYNLLQEFDFYLAKGGYNLVGD